MAFKIIVAVDKNRGIGINNQLPWHLKADMQWFKKATLGQDPNQENVVIMGRKTWDSIPAKFKPLPQRKNIVITRHPEQCQAPYTAPNFEQALELAYSFNGEVFVAGGSSIYELAFQHPDLSELYITEIDKDFKCDRFFPEYSHWKKQKTVSTDSEDGLNYTIQLYHL
jgi:dihydrofolate reductase